MPGKRSAVPGLRHQVGLERFKPCPVMPKSKPVKDVRLRRSSRQFATESSSQDFAQIMRRPLLLKVARRDTTHPTESGGH